MPIKKKTTVELPLEDSIQIPSQFEIPSEKKVLKDKEPIKIVSIETLRTQSVERMQVLFDGLIKETNTLEDLKRKTKEEIELEKRQIKQQQEQENFTSLLAERKRRAEFDEKLEKEKKMFEEEKMRKEEELRSKEAVLNASARELEDLKAQVESFPIKLTKAIEEAKKQAVAESKKDYEAEKALFNQKYSGETKLLEQQILGLQNQNKQQEKEIIYLKAEKTKAIEQINALAVAVINGGEKEVDSPTVNVVKS